MGPDIISLIDHGHQNPSSPMTVDPKHIKRRIYYYRLLRFLNLLRLYDVFKFFVGHEKSKTITKEKCLEYKYNVQLHGSCLIFSPVFVENEDKAFCPETFLYTEEPILYQYCMHKGYLTLYCPDLLVEHKEDSSTNATYKANCDKREFVFKNLIYSHNVYYRKLKEFKKDN